MTIPEPVLAVRDLRVTYQTARGPVQAVKGASLTVPPGRIFGLVGESGSGKSSVALAVMGALGSRGLVSGEVRYRGENLLGKPERELRQLWGRRLAIVFQDPGSTLNPVLPAGEQVVEVLREHERIGRGEARTRMLDLFRAVQLPNPAEIARRYPHQLSGGQQQRVSIAIALACDPDLLILDEPTTGLDVTTEARILDLVESLRERTRAAILYITHNLGVIARLCDEVAVMYAGEVVEHGTVRAVFARPCHPYTVALLDCLPRVEAPRAARLLPAIEGSLPDPGTEIPGCQFAPRCPVAEDRCGRERPPLVEVVAGQASRCFLWDRVPRPAGLGPASTGQAPRAEAPAAPLLEAVEVAHAYQHPIRSLVHLRRQPGVQALSGVSLDVAPGETVALVGESGSGKTTMGRCIVGLLRPTRGAIRLEGRDLPGGLATWPRALRRRLQVVFQNPDLTLNPRRRILDAVARPLELFGLAEARARRDRAAELLRAVRLGERYLDLYPDQLSGGERQRVAIARAFACGPELVVCDEPTSALDVSVQATVLNLLVDLQARQHTSYLFISHDLSVVRHIADRVVVLYLGKVCEAGATADVFAPPYHPYTEALLSAVPSLSRPRREGAIRLEGPAPNPTAPPAGCPFHPRCPRKLGPICEEREPPLVANARRHAIACHIPRAELLRLQAPAAQSPTRSIPSPEQAEMNGRSPIGEG
jgi:peptide/nickel transport system ATP-binding protein